MIYAERNALTGSTLEAIQAGYTALRPTTKAMAMATPIFWAQHPLCPYS